MKEICLNTPRGPLTALRHGDPDRQRVLALHGWLDNAASFIPLFPYLSDFDIVALDLPGHGGSSHRQPGYDYALADWIHDVLDALDALAWPQASLLGHSMGGAIATAVAAAAPERVNKLALIEAIGPLVGKSDEAGIRLRRAVSARRAFDPSRPPRVIPSLEAAVTARRLASDMTPDAAQLIVQRNLKPIEGGLAWRSDPRLMLPSHTHLDETSARSWIRAIKAPTLVIAADPSPVYFTAELRNARMAELCDGQLEVIRGGHHLHMEQPEVIAPRLCKFLE